MVFELQPQIDDESRISTKSQSVFCGQQLAIGLQAHCTCYLQSMGSTAFLSIHHTIPYVHLSMSYTISRPSWAWPIGYSYFSELCRPVSSSTQQG